MAHCYCLFLEMITCGKEEDLGMLKEQATLGGGNVKWLACKSWGFVCFLGTF